MFLFLLLRYRDASQFPGTIWAEERKKERERGGIARDSIVLSFLSLLVKGGGERRGKKKKKSFTRRFIPARVWPSSKTEVYIDSWGRALFTADENVSCPPSLSLRAGTSIGRYLNLSLSLYFTSFGFCFFPFFLFLPEVKYLWVASSSSFSSSRRRKETRRCSTRHRIPVTFEELSQAKAALLSRS